MDSKSLTPIPVNIIAGPLGVGKTTTINHLLKQRPSNEKWAILVNEYGLVGLDAALLDSRPKSRERSSIEIREVAGGCICCSAGFMFDMSLVLLLQRRPHRLLIEPTGLAALSGILDTLERPGIREAVDLRSMICLLDPSRLQKDLVRDEMQDQIEGADILLASHTDLATQDTLKAFEAWAHGLFPPKVLIGQIERGHIPLSTLDLVSERIGNIPRTGHQHGKVHDHHDHDHHNHHDHHDHHHAHSKVTSQDPTESLCDEDLVVDAARPMIRRSHASPEGSAVGWLCWDGLLFSAEKVAHWLNERMQSSEALRVKAVLRTDQGYQIFNFTDAVREVKASSYRRDSRLEVIFKDEYLPDLEGLEATLSDCISTIDSQ